MKTGPAPALPESVWESEHLKLQLLAEGVDVDAAIAWQGAGRRFEANVRGSFQRQRNQAK